MPEPTTDHHQCRHLKMDGVRCRRQIPFGHSHCYHHRHNRNPSFVRHHGKIRVPLLEDVSALQVTTTAAVHALLNGSLDVREVRTVLYGVNTAARTLRLDLAEKRWLHQTGQTCPEPVVDFAVMGHEHVALEDPTPASCNLQPETGNLEPDPCALPSRPCSSLDPEDDLLTPETFRPFDEEMRIPLPAPGEHDPLRIDGKDWPCPYRFNYCKGPGPKASCHYCTGELRWEDVHPGEPDPGAPGPLPTVDLHWTFIPHRDIAAPNVILSEPSDSGALAVGRNHQCSRESNGLAFPPETNSHRETDCEPESIDNPETRISELQSDPEPVAEEKLLPVLVASAEELPDPLPAPGSRLPPDVTNAHQQNQPLPLPMPIVFASIFPAAVAQKDKAAILAKEPPPVCDARRAQGRFGFRPVGAGLRKAGIELPRIGRFVVE